MNHATSTLALLTVLACACSTSPADEPLETATGSTDTAQPPTDDELHAMDSDGDGYSDLVEMERGTDPHDALSVVYQSGWPAQRQSVLDELEATFSADDGPLGYTMSDLSLPDKANETLRMRDLTAAGKPVVVLMTAFSVGPVNVLYDCLDNRQDTQCYDEYKSRIQPLIDALAEERVLLVNVLTDGEDWEPADLEDVNAFATAHPVPGSGYLYDPDQSLRNEIDLQYWPTVFLLNDKLQMTHWDLEPVMTVLAGPLTATE